MKDDKEVSYPLYFYITTDTNVNELLCGSFENWILCAIYGVLLYTEAFCLRNCLGGISILQLLFNNLNGIYFRAMFWGMHITANPVVRFVANLFQVKILILSILETEKISVDFQKIRLSQMNKKVVINRRGQKRGRKGRR